jgi:hypothetical protein
VTPLGEDFDFGGGGGVGKFSEKEEREEGAQQSDALAAIECIEDRNSVHSDEVDYSSDISSESDSVADQHAAGATGATAGGGGRGKGPTLCA